MQANLDQKNFRVFGPDETATNRLGDVITGTGKAWMAETLPVDENLSQTGRVMEVLSEHMCQGWLEGYLLTGGTDSSPATKRSFTSSTRW